MLKLFSRAMYICLLSVTLLLIGCNSKNTSSKLPTSKPEDFNFVLNYGVYARNQLDTIKGQYTKDMVGEPSITTDLKLSDDEMNIIYSEMKKIEILSYPDYFNPPNNVIETPFQTYSLKIFIDGNEKNINWKDKNASQAEEAVQLRNLFMLINRIIINRDEYKKLPEAKGAYN